jgi:DNA repair protein RadC
MGWLNVVQSYHSVKQIGNIIGATFQQLIHVAEKTIFFLVFIPLWQVHIMDRFIQNNLNHMSIKSWLLSDQPMHKLHQKGSKHLTNSELIAILIQQGTVKENAVDLARNLLSKCNNDLQKMAKLSVNDLIALKINGIGKSKAIRIIAAIELGSRRIFQQKLDHQIFQSSDVISYLKYSLQFESREIFMVLLLNQANKIIHEQILSEGGITGTVADPRVLFKLALSHEATGVIICHNHPSGQLQPSKMDDQLTEKVKKAAQFLDIKLIDHIIVSTQGYYSYAEQSPHW